MTRSVVQLIVVALIALGVVIPAGAHGDQEHSYSCGQWLRVEHSSPGSKHYAAGIPTGSSNGCDYYKAKVIVTNWSGGGSQGWYMHPNHGEEGLWQTSWWNNIVGDNYYCYFVRAEAKGKKGSSDYGWRFYYHGSQPSCWYG